MVIKCSQLEFVNSHKEPFYLSLSLHDIQTKQKLTEDFNFELNDKEFQNLWHNSPNPITSTEKCSIPLLVTHNRLATFVIIRIYRHIIIDPDKVNKKGVSLLFSLFSLLKNWFRKDNMMIFLLMMLRKLDFVFNLLFGLLLIYI